MRFASVLIFTFGFGGLASAGPSAVKGDHVEGLSVLNARAAIAFQVAAQKSATESIRETAQSEVPRLRTPSIR